MKKANYASFVNRVPVSKLRKLFREAIQLTRKIGLEYLWIDSFCIIQDCNSDWAKESTMMSSIYSNGICNIAATGFADGTKGLFARRRSSLVEPVAVDVPSDLHLEEQVAYPQGQYFLYDFDVWKQEVDDAPLNRRAWVMQERFLSPRSLHFGTKQLFWECRKSEACEAFPLGLPSHLPRTNTKRVDQDRPRGDKSLVSSQHRNTITRSHVQSMRLSESCGQWPQIVDEYTSKQITYGSDRLVAIAGLAKMMQRGLKSQYLAGMWRRDLIGQLAWSVDPFLVRPRPAEYRSPSWSWASVDSPVSLAHWYVDEHRATHLARVLDAQTTPAAADADEFGPVQSGRLTIRGPLGLARLYMDSEPQPQDRPVTTISGWLKEDVLLDAIDPSTGWGASEPVRAIRRVVVADDDDPERFRFRFFDDDDRASPVSLCFFMPTAVHKDAKGRDQKLVGLLLLPTGRARGEFRRVGMFAAQTGNTIAYWKSPTAAGGVVVEEEYYVERAPDGESVVYTINIV